MSIQNKKIEFKKDGFVGQKMVYVPGIVKKKVLKDRRIYDLYITHIGIFPTALGHYRNRPLGSSQFILIYCTEGKGWVESVNTRVSLAANQMYIISPKTVCRYGADNKNPWTVYWVHFTGENAAEYAPVTDKVIQVLPAHNARIEERIVLFKEILQNIHDYFNAEKVVYANICLKQFLTSVKYMDVYRSVKKESDNDLLNKLISYLKNNVHKTILIDEMAEACNCSKSNIYKLFKTHLNSAPQEFFIHLKIEKARKYLINTRLKVKEISHKLGYDDPYYFSRIFTRHVGLSPAKYRKEER